MRFGRWKILSSRRLRFAGAFCAAIVGTFALPCFGQQSSTDQGTPLKPANGTARLRSHDSITVTATYTPAEKEESKIDALYETIYTLQYKGDCDTAIQRYRNEVIPLAEKSEFARPKNKFLFLAYQGIAVCYMNQGLYGQAEQVFLKLMDYLPTWPGLDDLEYPVYLRHLGTAQMKQEHWQAAEESLQKSISVCDSQIEKALKAESRLAPAEQAGYARAEKARSLMYLAAAYTRQGRMADALATADKSYDTATQPAVPAEDLNSIVKTGIEIALASKDQDAMMKWSRRVPDQK